MSSATGSRGGFFQFSRPFYVINGIELLERGAFYSMNAVLSVYMSLTLGFPAEQVGLIASILFLLLYVVPLVGAALAEKYGYKAALVASFVLLAGGYATTLIASEFLMMLAAVTLVGFGAGIFKPIAAALVGETTTEEQRNFAFVIYYGAINLGAFLFPLSVGLAGVLYPERLHVFAFGAAAALSAINFALVLMMFKNLREPDREKNLFQAFATLGEVLKNWKFLILLVIYSGFWFLYAMALSFLYVYMVEFGRMPAWFNPALANTINPLVIVLFAPLMGALTRPFRSLTVIIFGISLYVFGFVVVGFSSVWWLFLGGILIFSVGEVLTHPSYLSYVSKIAPPDRVAVYMGYGFLPIAVGLFFGAGVGGVLYAKYAQTGQPALFWAIMSAVGLLSVSAFLIYDRLVSPRKAAEPEAPKRRALGGAAASFGLAALALLLVPALVMAGAAVPGGTPIASASTGTESIGSATLATVALAGISGEAGEGEEVVETITLPENATGTAVFTLTWTDEAAGNPGMQNTPDTFLVKVKRPDGTVVESEAVANPQGGEGLIEVRLEGASAGVYEVTIAAQACGDTEPAVPVVPFGALPAGTTADAGNAYTLAVTHQATPG